MAQPGEETASRVTQAEEEVAEEQQPGSLKWCCWEERCNQHRLKREEFGPGGGKDGPREDI